MQDELLDILREAGALITGSHIVGTSGRHMSAYINKDALLSHPTLTSRAGELFAQKNQELDVDIVAAPAMGAVILGQWTAYHLSRLKGKEVLSVYTDKADDDGAVLKRGYDKLVAGQRVLVIEDTTTTGGSVKKTADLVQAAGGNVVAVCIMVNRDIRRVTADTIGFPFSYLASLEADSYDSAECPLCNAGVPINPNVGHGKTLSRP